MVKMIVRGGCGSGRFGLALGEGRLVHVAVLNSEEKKKKILNARTEQCSGKGRRSAALPARDVKQRANQAAPTKEKESHNTKARAFHILGGIKRS